MAIVATTLTFPELVARKTPQGEVLAMVQSGKLSLGTARRYLAYLASPGNWGQKRTLRSLVRDNVSRKELLGMLQRGAVSTRVAKQYLRHLDLSAALVEREARLAAQREQEEWERTSLFRKYSQPVA